MEIKKMGLNPFVQVFYSNKELKVWITLLP